MGIELRILTGARAGQTEWFDKDVIAIGRHPSSDFLLDVKKDLDVSRRHGEIRQVDAAMKSGFGVMLDDIVAAGYSLLVFALAARAVEMQ